MRYPFCYNMSMNNTYSKLYFEKYASLTLAEYFHIPDQAFLHAECPDLAIPSMSIGIEVTQALTAQEAAADKKKYLYNLEVMNPFDQDDDEVSYVYEKIKKGIERKNEKSAHYSNYEHNGLYIFAHSRRIFPDELKTFFKTISPVSSFFEVIYINCVTSLMIYHIKEGRIEIVLLSREKLLAMHSKSLAYEKVCTKKVKPIIL